MGDAPTIISSYMALGGSIKVESGAIILGSNTVTGTGERNTIGACCC